jgi:hypothetical protein
MTGAFHHIAVASLPVAIGLLGLTAVARTVLWARVKDARIDRLAAEHVDPLSTWCLILIAVHAVALGGAGELGAGGLAVAVIVAVAAVLLRAGGDAVAEEEPGDTPAWAAGARDRAAAPGDGVAASGERATAPAGTPARSLWTDADDHPRHGLWT